MVKQTVMASTFSVEHVCVDFLSKSHMDLVTNKLLRHAAVLKLALLFLSSVDIPERDELTEAIL